MGRRIWLEDLDQTVFLALPEELGRADDAHARTAAFSDIRQYFHPLPRTRTGVARNMPLSRIPGALYESILE